MSLNNVLIRLSRCNSRRLSSSSTTTTFILQNKGVSQRGVAGLALGGNGSIEYHFFVLDGEHKRNSIQQQGKRQISSSILGNKNRAVEIKTVSYCFHHQQHDCFQKILFNNSWKSSYTTSSSVLQKEYPVHTLFPMPALSPTMDVGTIATWYIQEGDAFTPGTALCSIETDKASVDFEAQDDGVLAKILKQGPTAIDIKIGTPICVIVDDKADVPAFADYAVDDSNTVVEASGDDDSSTSSDDDSVITTSAATGLNPSGTSILLPSARYLSESKGIDATVLQGTGKGGRVTKGDVLKAIADGSLPKQALSSTTITSSTNSSVAVPPSAAPAGATTTVSIPPPSLASISVVPNPEIISNNPYEEVPNNKMRKIIAARLTESKRDVPHFYTSMEVELDNILKLRKKLAGKHDIKVSVNDFIIRCSALALRDVPEVNASYNVKTDSIQLNHAIDVSVAVATPTGLITPIVFGADTLGLVEISTTIQDLAGRARIGKLAPQEYQGGSFSVSNLGMFGISEFSAVINPPQAAILAVGGGTRSVVATPYKDGGDEQIPPSIKTIMTARLSADRRVVDEATAALFVSALRQYINQPELLLL